MFFGPITGSDYYHTPPINTNMYGRIEEFNGK